jgi:hypothetical protein
LIEEAVAENPIIGENSGVVVNEILTPKIAIEDLEKRDRDAE